MKKITPLLFLFIAIQVGAQTKSAKTKPAVNPIGSDKLLWYKGKMTDSNSLVTQDGKVVVFAKTSTFLQVIIKNEPPHIKKIRKRLQKKEQDKNVLVKKAIENRGASYYITTKKMVNEQEVVDRVFGNVTSNEINLNQPIRNPYNDITAEDETENKATAKTIKEGHKEIMDYVKSIIGNKISDLPPFPKSEYPCSYCVENTAEKQNQIESYFQELYGKEVEIIQKSIKLQRQFALMSPQTADLKKLITDLEDANLKIYQRMREISDKLFEQNKKELESLFSIMPILMSVERQVQLLGAPDQDAASNIIGKILDVFTLEAIMNFMKDKVEKKDFRYIINPSIYIGLVRQAMLLGAIEDERYVELIQTILDQNRFQFDMTLDMKRLPNGYEAEDVFIKAQLVSDPFYYSVVETPDCRYLLVSTQGKQTVFSKGRLMPLNIKQAQHSECTYVGPKSLSVPAPIIHLDFCQDTARLEFSFAIDWSEKDEKWNCKNGANDDFIKNMLSDGFNNRRDDKEEQMDELTNSGAGEALEDMASGQDPSIANLAELEKYGPKAIAQFQKMYEYRQYIKRVTITNFSETIIDETLDGKETHDEGDQRFQYAWLKIKLKHAPAAPAK